MAGNSCLESVLTYDSSGRKIEEQNDGNGEEAHGFSLLQDTKNLIFTSPTQLIKYF